MAILWDWRGHVQYQCVYIYRKQQWILEWSTGKFQVNDLDKDDLGDSHVGLMEQLWTTIIVAIQRYPCQPVVTSLNKLAYKDAVCRAISSTGISHTTHQVCPQTLNGLCSGSRQSRCCLLQWKFPRALAKVSVLLKLPLIIECNDSFITLGSLKKTHLMKSQCLLIFICNKQMPPFCFG